MSTTATPEPPQDGSSARTPAASSRRGRIEAITAYMAGKPNAKRGERRWTIMQPESCVNPQTMPSCNP